MRPTRTARRGTRRASQQYLAEQLGRINQARVERGCLTPTKRAFDDAATALRENPLDLNVYECPCGAWHHTGEPGEKVRTLDMQHHTRPAVDDAPRPPLQMGGGR